MSGLALRSTRISFVLPSTLSWFLGADGADWLHLLDL
jgi:hypothetical protein